MNYFLMRKTLAIVVITAIVATTTMTIAAPISARIPVPDDYIVKYEPTRIPQPAFTIDIVGGKGFTVKVVNTGDGNATDVVCNVEIIGGLFVNPKHFSGTQETLAIGGNLTILGAPKGIGLGFIFELPRIKINVNCTEGINATKTVIAKIFFSMITLQ